MVLKMARSWWGRRRQPHKRDTRARPVRRLARRVVMTLVMLALLVCLLCLLLGVMIRAAAAQDPDVAGIDVMLVIDNSNSMFDKGGTGSDPELRRIEAAQLFITYLGVDSGVVDHRLGVIGYGGRAEEVLPLTSLAGADRRRQMAELIADPKRMAWTNPVAALRLAQEGLGTTGPTDRRQSVVLLTDGKPEWDSTPTVAERAAVVADLRRIGETYVEQGVELYILLLENSATDADPEIARVYVPLWRELAGATGGRFYAIRKADGLISIYHDVLLALSGAATDGAVVDVAVTGGMERHVIDVEPNLQRVTFVIRVVEAQGASVVVTVVQPDGRVLRAGDPSVRHTAYGMTAIWAVDDPAPGNWAVELVGEGNVTVWKDYVTGPVSTPTLTPTPRPTATPTATPSPTPTGTPVPAIVVVAWPEALLCGEMTTVAVRFEPAASDPVDVWATWATDGATSGRARLLDDGRSGDSMGGDGVFTTVLMPGIPGMLELRVWYEVAGRELGRWVGRASVEVAPQLSMVLPAEGAVWRTGRTEDVMTRWVMGEEPVDASGVVSVTITDASGDVVAMADGAPGKALTLAVPEVRGAYTVTARAVGETPGRVHFDGVVSVLVQVRRPFPVWAIGAGLAGVVAIGAGVRGYSWYRTRPQLVGTLRVLSKPATYTGAMVADLSLLGKRTLHLGGQDGLCASPTRINPWAELEAQDDGSGVVLTAADDVAVLVNSRVARRTTLSDGDIITVDGLRLRYECLQMEASW